jgi:hypothetical protein
VSASWSSGLPYSVVNRFFATDNFDYLQFRTRFGFVDDGNNSTGARQFVTVERNSERNQSIYDINLRARKSMVIGRFSAAVFFEVFNLLNTDDLRIFTFDPTAPQVNNATPDNLDPDNVLGAVQLDARRRFGRRYQVGFQFDF